MASVQLFFFLTLTLFESARATAQGCCRKLPPRRSGRHRKADPPARAPSRGFDGWVEILQGSLDAMTLEFTQVCASQQVSCRCQGQPGAQNPTTSQSFTQSVEGRGCQEVPGRVVECLYRERPRVMPKVLELAAASRYPHAHLNQAVEAPPPTPRPTPAVRIQGDVYQVGVEVEQY